MEALKFIIFTSKQNGFLDNYFCNHEIEMFNVIPKMNDLIINTNNIMIKKCNCISLMSCCAKNGYLSWLKYLHKRSLAESERSLAESERSLAESERSLAESEQSLAEGKKECPWDEQICACAAQGHLDCLIYLHENGCPWDMESIKNATYDHLSCLVYLHKHGCPWDEYVCACAAQG
ncbi:MAG: hypothetical protein KAS12_04250, partial [Candidatus Aenigmarchaeota archaeon]|nr:hypothetical protein [Candidatus Aenigmarchaeota archaeon]